MRDPRFFAATAGRIILENVRRGGYTETPTVRTPRIDPPRAAAAALLDSEILTRRTFLALAAGLLIAPIEAAPAGICRFPTAA
jgi:hypothetical protein